MQMTNDELLEAVQEEPVHDEYEREISQMAGRIAVATGIICLMVMFLVEWFLLKQYDFGKPFLVFLMSGIADVIEGRKKTKRFMFIRGIGSLLLAVLFLLIYITRLMGVE